jgi:ABC-type antimicrobial peptide transport system permease subunit
MSLANTIRTALRGLTANKLRAFLTMLGVIIGVASVIAMLSIGNGARAAVESSFRFLGSDSIQISVAKALDNGQLVDAGKILSYEDGLGIPAAVPLVNRVEMSLNGSGKVRYGGTVIDMNFTGATPDALGSLAAQAQVQPVGWPDGKPLDPEAFLGQGRFFDLQEVLSSTPVCVLGYDTADGLFHGDNPLGQVIWVDRARCTVIGVLTEVETIDPAERYRSRPNEVLLMPISTLINNFYDKEPSVSIVVHVIDEKRIDEAQDQIKAYLRQRHDVQKDENGDYQDDFIMNTKQDVLGAQQAAANTFATLLAAMASISLVVGGIGIMNVMLVGVSERTREIGVRLAVGAQRADITAQFLIEASLISLAGGLLGIAAGILAIPLAASYNQGLALLDPNSIPLALGVALLTGLLFGLYPAVRAARLDPIQALRYE